MSPSHFCSRLLSSEEEAEHDGKGSSDACQSGDDERALRRRCLIGGQMVKMVTMANMVKMVMMASLRPFDLYQVDVLDHPATSYGKQR